MLGVPSDRPHELWTVFDDLREWNAQAGRIVTVSSVALAALGLMDLKGTVEKNIMAVASAYPLALPGPSVVILGGGVAALGVVASIVLAYLALVEALPRNRSDKPAAEGLVEFKRQTCRASVGYLGAAAVALFIAEFVDNWSAVETELRSGNSFISLGQLVVATIGGFVLTAALTFLVALLFRWVVRSVLSRLEYRFQSPVVVRPKQIDERRVNPERELQ